MKNAKLFLIIGPSGVGKGTALRNIKKKHPEWFFPVSYTTRAKRPAEQPGETYHFINKDEFEEKIQNNFFLEWQMVHGQDLYGTDKGSIQESLKNGIHAIREMDIQGVESILAKKTELPIKTIFLATDSWETLLSRINRRSKLSEQEIQRRHASYIKEMEFLQKSDYLVYSDEGQINKLVTDIENIISKY
jgi:guanylate kinase